MPLKIAFFGDSVCVGQGVSITDGWVSQVAKQFNQPNQSIEGGVVVSNISVNGRTSRQALEDMPYHIQSQGIDLLILQFGLNDCNFWLSDHGLPRVSKQAYSANMLEMVDRAFASGVQRVIVNSNHPTARRQIVLPHEPVSYEDNNEAYYLTLQDIFARPRGGLKFVDVRRFFIDFLRNSETTIESLLLDDGLHLNVSGHNVYFDAVFPTIVSCSRELLQS